MMKDSQSDKAVDYIINQIKELEKNVDDYKYDINSIQLELESICNKMNEVLNSGDKTQELFISTNNNKYKDIEYKKLYNKKEALEDLKKKKVCELDNVINKINEMKEVINISPDEDSEDVHNNESESGLNDSDSEILWILEEDRQRISRDIHDTVVQNLTALIHKGEFINQIVDKDVNRAKIEINNAKLLIKDSVRDLRNIIYQLRPMELDDLGFNEALLNLIDKLDDNYKDIMIHTTIDCSDDISQIASISSLRIIKGIDNSNRNYKVTNITKIVPVLDESFPFETDNEAYKVINASRHR